MAACDPYQAQLLDFVYDVVEGAELQALRDHLAVCSACQASLESARAQQRLLAAAARIGHAGVRFEAPAVQPAPSEIGDIPAPASQRWQWAPLAMAACLLLAMGGLGVAGFLLWPRSHWEAAYTRLARQANQVEEDHRIALANTQDHLDQVLQERGAIERQLQEGLDEIDGRQLTLVVSGPRTIEPGAPNSYEIQTRDARGQPVPANLDVRVLVREKAQAQARMLAAPAADRAKTKAEPPAARRAAPSDQVVEDKHISSPGDYQLALPASLQSKPDTEVVLEVVARREGEGGIREQVRGNLELARPTYLIQLTPDRPRYQPGDTVRFSSLVLDRFSLKPAAEDFTNIYQLKDPSGKEVARRASVGNPDDALVKGIGAGEFKLDPNSPDGEYTLTVREASNRYPPQERKFYVSSAASPNKAEVPAIRAVPEKVQVEFFPEGGDLVAGVPNRVYFQARTALDKPIDLKGRLVDQDGQVVVNDVHTAQADRQPAANPGIGVFEMIPQAGRRYELRLGSPNGIDLEARWPSRANHDRAARWPEIVEYGVSLNIPDGVTSGSKPLRVRVRSPRSDRNLLVGAYCRGRLMAHRSIHVQRDELAEVDLKPDQPVGGVYRVTVFEQRPAAGNSVQLIPLAERLVYRVPTEQLNLTVIPDKQTYLPGDKATLRFQAANDHKDPAAAVVLATVVDERELTAADQKAYRSLPASFYLLSEVRRPEDLEDADFLLSPDGKPALDLLLGTQGWRRFAEQDPGKFQQRSLADQKAMEDASRLLVLNGQASPEAVDFLQKKRETVQAAAALRHAELEGRLDTVRRAREGIDEDAQYRSELDGLRSEVQAASHKAADAAQAWETFRSRVVPALAALLLVIALAALGTGFARGLARAVPFFTAAACALLLLGVAGTLFFQGHRSPDDVAQLVPAPGRDRTEADAVPRKPGVVGTEAAPVKQQAASGKTGDLKEEKLDNVASPDLPTRPAAAAAPAPTAADKDVAAGPNAAAQGSLSRAQDERSRLQMNRAKEPSPGGPAASTPAPITPLRRDAMPADSLDRKADAAAPKPEASPLKAPAMKNMMPMAVPAAGVAGSGGGKLAGKAAIMPQEQSLRLREYAFQGGAWNAGEPRPGGTGTLYWQPALILPDGKASVSFDLPNVAATYQIIVHGHTLDGWLGSVRTTLEVQPK